MANTQTTQTNLPSWVQQPTQGAISDISSWLKSPDNYVYGSKPGEKLYTPLTESQNQAIGNTNWMADQDLRKLLGINEAQGMYEGYGAAKPSLLTGNYANTAGQNLGTERVVDEGGFLGKISDYMNPYIQDVLNPQLRELGNQLQLGRNDLGASEMMSGAFGDARHGIEESQLYKDNAQAATDLTGKAYSDAFNEAMGLRSGDEARKAQIDLSKAQFGDADAGRLLTRDTLNQAEREKALDRKATAAKGVTDLGQLFFKNFNDTNDALFNAGKIQRDAGEEQRTAIENFQKAISEKRYNDAIKMLGALQGSPQPTTSTTTNKSNDGLFGIISSLLGAAL